MKKASPQKVRITKQQISDYRVAQKAKKNNEPTEIREDHYVMDLTEILKHYNINVDNKTKKDWALTYFKNDKEAKEHLSPLSHQYFTTLGPLIRMMENGVEIRGDFKERINREKDRLVEISKNKVYEKEDDTSQNGMVKIPKTDYFLGDFEGICDDVFGQKSPVVNLTSYFLEHKPNAAQMNQLKSLIREKIREFEEVKTDKELFAAYPYSKKEIDYILKFLDETLKSIEIKTLRKPKPKKVKSSNEIAAKVKYLKNDASLNLESLEPAVLIGKKSCVAFNTKNRKLIVFKSTDDGFTFSGTTLYNVDTDLSKQKTIRDPKTQLLNLLQLTKSGFEKGFDLIKSVETEPSPRFSEDLLILRVFS